MKQTEPLQIQKPLQRGLAKAPTIPEHEHLVALVLSLLVVAVVQILVTNARMRTALFSGKERREDVVDKKREYWHCSMWVLGTAAHSCSVTYAFFVNETCYVFFFITVFVGKK